MLTPVGTHRRDSSTPKRDERRDLNSLSTREKDLNRESAWVNCSLYIVRHVTLTTDEEELFDLKEIIAIMSEHAQTAYREDGGLQGMTVIGTLAVESGFTPNGRNRIDYLVLYRVDGHDE